jgi:hypothetical protein
MTLPGILAVGERISEIEALVDAIRSDQTDGIASSDSLWTMNNKYYTVQVAISILAATGGSNSFNIPSHIDHQAVVAVFNSAVDTLETMQQLWAAVEDQGNGFEIQLAVVLCVDGCARPFWLEQADVWFAERSTELVVIEKFERSDAPRLAAAAEGGNCEGIERVVEALQAHLWPGMQRKDADGKCIDGGTLGHEPLTAAEPSIESLLQETLLHDDTVEDSDEANKLFAEVLGRFAFSFSHFVVPVQLCDINTIFGLF